MRLETVKLENLIPAEYNPRIDLRPGDPEYENLRRSIEEFGMVEPIVWNQRTGRVVGGHQRLKVLVEMGVTETEVVVVDLDDTKEKALNLALNKIEGDWDNFKLKELLEELDTGEIDLSITGFDESEIEKLMTDFALASDDEVRDDNFDVDEALDEIVVPNTHRGDVWRLGRHLLLCGDATRREDILRLMAGHKAQMVFTDPPYNVNYQGQAGTIKNDHMSEREFYEFLLSAFRNAFEAAVEGGSIYVAHADSHGKAFRLAFEDAGWLMKQCLIWVKNALVMGRQDYHWRHEPILYGWKPGAKHSWYGGRKQSTVIESSVGVTISNDEKGTLLTFASGVHSVVLRVPSYEVVFQGTDEQTSIWRFEKPAKNSDHPTMKPIPLVARALQNSSKKGEIVLDMFLGSGTTLMAAEQTGRVCYGLELDERYCDVVIRRWEEFTGQRAVKLDGRT
ncbi:methyltransferase [Alicyclobacillus contaminans]|uniref:site-specific DNA-methyltransferase n=1 Tax=Alicyclobacillus contaminans TaxID=392016 RepID=UPI00041EBAA7|nr:site-specific DNA-methyltransferase [Alicyclobacillus contaminans]GMA49339.1 methyltransferase [Alicyclobacillus contaminans]